VAPPDDVDHRRDPDHDDEHAEKPPEPCHALRPFVDDQAKRRNERQAARHPGGMNRRADHPRRRQETLAQTGGEGFEPSTLWDEEKRRFAMM
jgi:hypothetical protein